MTAPGSTRPHVDAVLAALTAGSVTAYNAERPAGGAADRYVVLYFDAGTDGGTLGDRHRWLTVEFQATAVGTSAEQAAWTADRARAVLLAANVAVAGRSVSPLWQVGSPPPVQRDDDLSPPLWYQPVSYQFRSGPA